ncbi:hypothetical protein DMENIID0001_023710 [Sergentomyia squamirostris]
MPPRLVQHIRAHLTSNPTIRGVSNFHREDAQISKQTQRECVAEEASSSHEEICHAEDPSGTDYYLFSRKENQTLEAILHLLPSLSRCVGGSHSHRGMRMMLVALVIQLYHERRSDSVCTTSLAGAHGASSTKSGLCMLARKHVLLRVLWLVIKRSLMYTQLFQFGFQHHERDYGFIGF